MRRHLPLITILFCQALCAALSMFLYFVSRPEFARIYENDDARLPFATRLSLTSWFLPSVVLATILCDLLALVLPKRSRKYAAVGAGLVLPASGLALAIAGIFVPLFEALPAP